MVDLKTGGLNGVPNSSPDNLVRAGSGFGIGNVRTLTASSGTGPYKATALKEGILGGIRSTDTTIIDAVDGSWQVVYNYEILDDGMLRVVPLESGGAYFLEIL